jgi:signal transduction histidine kinase
MNLGRERPEPQHRLRCTLLRSSVWRCGQSIIQTVYAVGLTLDYCRLTVRESPTDVETRLGEAASGLNPAISEIRDYIVELTHSVGEVTGLREAAESLAREYGRSTTPGLVPLTITVDVDDVRDVLDRADVDVDAGIPQDIADTLRRLSSRSCPRGVRDECSLLG